MRNRDLVMELFIIVWKQKSSLEDRIRLFNLMNKIKSDTISQDKINSVLNQLREGTAFNIHTQSPVSF